MRKFLFIALLFATVAVWSRDSADVIGAWEGESKCTVPDSPCRDEHVVYHIASDKQDATKLTIDADKIVNGKAEFMGTVSCVYHADESLLSCTIVDFQQPNLWEFHISGEAMTGTLVLGPDKKLYRRVSLRRVREKKN
jgi:hypothetical protein